MMKILSLMLIIGLPGLPVQTRWTPDESWLRSPHPRNRPKDGFVTKKETAIAIGRAIIEERYGAKFLDEQGPYDAKRFKDTWVVYGFKPVYLTGGTVNVLVSAKTGAVLNVFIEQ